MADQIKIESLSLECSKPGQECPRISVDHIEDVVYLESKDEYQLTLDGEINIAKEHGLLVTYSEEKAVEDSEEMTIVKSNRFFPMSKVELSPDSDFYMCAKGREFTLSSDVDLSQIGLDSTLTSDNIFQNFKPTSTVCKCFWAPRSLFNELGIDKIGKGSGKPSLPPGFPIPEDGTIIDEILNPKNPSTSILHPNPNNPTTLFPRTPLFPLYPNPRTPYVPTVTTPPPSVVGSPCGMFQFGCMMQFFKKD